MMIRDVTSGLGDGKFADWGGVLIASEQTCEMLPRERAFEGWG